MTDVSSQPQRRPRGVLLLPQLSSVDRQGNQRDGLINQRKSSFVIRSSFPFRRLLLRKRVKAAIVRMIQSLMLGEMKDSSTCSLLLGSWAGSMPRRLVGESLN